MKINKLILPVLFLAAAAPVFAQRKVSADVEVRTVNKGKLTTVTKSVYCTNNGRLVTIFRTPLSYCTVSNAKGEFQLYNEDTNEVISKIDKSLSSNNELVMLFLNGHIDDLGLGYYGYKVTGSARDDGYLVKTFTAADPNLPKVEIAYENYLPIYCAYTSPEGKLMSRKYLSDYQRFGRMVLPLRVTDISYGTAKDSTIVRTLYSAVKIDTDDPSFDFSVPADAKPAKLEEPGK